MSAEQPTNEAPEEQSAGEAEAMLGVVHALESYLPSSLDANNARRRAFLALPRAHQAILANVGPVLPLPVLHPALKHAQAQEEGPEISPISPGKGVAARLNEVDDRIRRNADVTSLIAMQARGFLGILPGSEEDGHAHHHGPEHGGHSHDEPDHGHSHDHSAPSHGHSHADTNHGHSHHEPSHGHSHDHADPSHSHAHDELRGSGSSLASEDAVDKVRSTLKQYMRDWSLEGATERQGAYEPVLEVLAKYLPQPLKDGKGIEGRKSVLVPGAGLGRLSFEIAKRGYASQGNEFDYHMLLASNLVLNLAQIPNMFTIYPFVHGSNNWTSAAEMLKPITFPDVAPIAEFSELDVTPDFSMVAGEFVQVYNKDDERGQWDAVTSVFFIDTAANVLRYLETINQALRVGGYWINVGPLLWHMAAGTKTDAHNGQGGGGVELTLEEVLALLEPMGFELVEQRRLPPQTYTGAPKGASLLSYFYEPHFWVARKVRDVTAAPIA